MSEQIASSSINGNGHAQQFTESLTRETFSDPIDQAQWLNQCNQVESKQWTRRLQLAQVEYAIEMFDEGKYGMCECCGEPIQTDRLAAVPEATLCCACKLAAERKQQTPGAQVLSLVPRSWDRTTRVTMTRLVKLHWQHAPSMRALELVWTHSLIVATIAEQLRLRTPVRLLDRNDVLSAALLHDIGVYRCIDWSPKSNQAMSPYIRHGVVGAHILRSEQFSGMLSRVAERHTGTGITIAEIKKRHLPLPQKDFIPETILEKLICYADKFHSKRLRFLNFEESVKEQRRFGSEKVDAMIRFREMFGVPDLEPIQADYEPWQQSFGSPSEL